MRRKIVDKIFEISKLPYAFDTLEEMFQGVSKDEVSNHIIEVGIMPETFDHDSSEEKLWSKYSDIMVCKALNYLGIESEVLRTRGDSADVYGKTIDYTLVADGKCFRLSRTAKNQKDFKVKALDDWRRKDTYAVLVSPLYQYPSRSSQIYTQAIEKNVTLISYIHLKFLLDSTNIPNLITLWETGIRLNESTTPVARKKAITYWHEIDESVCKIARKSLRDLKAYKEIEFNKTKELGEEGIAYWKSKMQEIRGLSKNEAIQRLIVVEKIDQKIQMIKKAIDINKNLLN